MIYPAGMLAVKSKLISYIYLQFFGTSTQIYLNILFFIFYLHCVIKFVIVLLNVKLSNPLKIKVKFFSISSLFI